MAVLTTSFSTEELRRIFNSFNAKFSEDSKGTVYKKMPYTEWRTLKNTLNNSSISSQVSIYYSTRDEELEVCMNAPPCKFIYSVTDNSFGQYLFFFVSKQMYGNATTTISVDNDDLKKIKSEENKEDNVMKFNFDFGPVVGNDVRMSMYGLAVKNKSGTYVSYDAKAGEIVDVDILNFDGAKFLYKVPVAIKDVAIGDVIVHHRVPMFVVAIAANGSFITAVDPVAGERKEVMLTKSPFGFNFITKVVNFLSNVTGTANADNPFGNLGLMLMMNQDGENTADMNDLLPLMLMSGNGLNLDFSNPMLMYVALCGNGSKDSILPLMLMANNATHQCTCGGQCEGHKD